MKKFFALFTILAVLSISSCKRPGCTEPKALNFDAKAQVNDHSCVYDNGYNWNNGGNNNGGGNNNTGTSLSIWTNNWRDLAVYVGYIDSGMVTQSRTTVPNCSGEAGCFHTNKIVAGNTYTIEGEDSEYSWKMDIKMNQGCNTVLLDQTGLGKMNPYEGQNVTIIKMVKKEKSGFTRFVSGIKNLLLKG